MLDLYTQKNFTVVRQIADHTDVSTYYVQAKIRNAYTDELLTTLNLTDKGSQRFKGDWPVPADPSGEGFFISIVTSVYTDSGYTTKSSSYGDEENTYKVINPPRSGGGGGVGMGGGLARRDIRDIFQEEFEKVAKSLKPEKSKEIKFPTQKEYSSNFKDVLKAIEQVKKSIKDPEKLDLSPILKQIKIIEKAIGAIDIPEKVDLEPVLSQLKDNAENSDTNKEELVSVFEEFIESFEEKTEKVFKKVLEETNFVTSSVTFVGGKNIPALHKKSMGMEEKDKNDIDITKLTAD